MSTLTKAMTPSEARYEQEKSFDPVAYAENVMKTVGADFHEDDPLFQTNEFRMHCYKILPCSKHFCHDWSVCPFAHFSERAKRRDPKEVKYTAIACPDMKKGEDCPRGDRCPYSHNTFEYWLHPTRYRTRLCRDNESCNRKICFFAHKPEEVRVPTSRPSLPISEEPWSADALTPKEEKEIETVANAYSLQTPCDTPKMDQMSQLHSYLQRSNLSINTLPKSEPTFVDQVLNGMLPTSGMPPMSLTDVQNLQIAQAAQNLTFDSCFQSSGFPQGAINPMVSGNGCFPVYDAFQGYGAGLSGFGNPSPQPMSFVSAGPQDLSVPQMSFPPLPTAKAQPDLNEVLQLLSSMQMATSPTSVLTQRHLNQGGLTQHAVSADSSAASGVAMSDTEMDSTQIANALMGLSGTCPQQGGGSHSPLFGMTL